MNLRTTLLTLTVVFSIGSVAAPVASASNLLGTGASDITLNVDSAGDALASYDTKAGHQRVLAWGAENADLKLTLDRTGGTASGRANPAAFVNACTPYTGPAIAHAVAECTAPDGSWWALQTWKRTTKDFGGTGGPNDVRISHWTGDLAVLTVATDWEFHGRYEHLFGTLTYNGTGWWGTQTTSTGYSLDGRSRNVAVDALDPVDGGTGWHRVNSFLTAAPSGEFCFGFSPKGPNKYVGRSKREQYRASVPGPGVTPDLFVAFTGHHGYSKSIDAAANAQQRTLAAGNPKSNCAGPN